MSSIPEKLSRLICRYLDHSCSRHLKKYLKIEANRIELPAAFQRYGADIQKRIPSCLKLPYLSNEQMRQLARKNLKDYVVTIADEDWEPRLDLNDFDIPPSIIVTKL